MMAMTTTQTLSEPLRVSFSPEQTLHNSYGVTQSRLGRLTLSRRFDYRETRELDNWMGFFNSGESPESANPLISSTPCVAGEDEHEQYSPSFKPENHSGSAEHKHYLGLLVIHCGCNHENQQPTGKEKGSTANAALWDACSSIHEENQSPKNFGDSQPSFRGEPNYESSVVHISTYTKSVGQSSCDSLAFLRCLRLISPSKAVTMNCAVLSLSFLTNSTACATSCGTRALIFCDLLLMLFGGITDLHIVWWVPVYTKFNYKKGLMWVPLGVYSGCQLDVYSFNFSETLTDCTPNRASIHNVTEAYTMEYSHSTQTRPEKKYLWRFLALNRSDMCAKPCRISVEAPTEHDARRVLAPFFILSLSARLSAQGVCNV